MASKMFKRLFCAFAVLLLFFSCSKEGVNDGPAASFTNLYVYGEAAEGLTAAKKHSFSKVYNAKNILETGAFEVYLKFLAGDFSLIDEKGSNWTLSSDGRLVKDGGASHFEEEGIYRVRVDAKTATWAKVKINSIAFRSFYGEKQQVEGNYKGLGRWEFADLSLDAKKDEVKYYRFEVDSDDESALACLGSTKDVNTADPESYKSAYQFVRSLGTGDLAGMNSETAAAFRFIAYDEGSTTITLQLSAGQARYIHYIDIAPPGPPAAFMGDSITENWNKASTGNPEFFTSNNYLPFGISGQTTTQMLARFESQVIANKPRCVVILGGTNDIAGNGGVVTNDYILENLSKMGEMAEAAKIKVILCSILPTNHYWWTDKITPGEIVSRIADMNRKIQALCNANDWTYVDYFSSMVNEADGGILDAYSDDRIHPNKDGYTVMEGIIRPVIRTVTGK